MILDNQGRLTLNAQKMPLPNEPQRSPGFVQKQSPEVFCKRRGSSEVRKFHRKKTVLASLFDKAAGPGLQLCEKETPRLVFSCEICEVFKNIYFKEHLRKTDSICFTSKYYSKQQWRVGTRRDLDRAQSKYFFNVTILFDQMQPYHLYVNVLLTCQLTFS